MACLSDVGPDARRSAWSYMPRHEYVECFLPEPPTEEAGGDELEEEEEEGLAVRTCDVEPGYRARPMQVVRVENVVEETWGGGRASGGSIRHRFGVEVCVPGSVWICGRSGVD